MLEELREKHRKDKEFQEAESMKRALLKKINHEKKLEELKKIDPMEIYTQKLMEKVIESNHEIEKKKKEQELMLKAKLP